ncbi:LamG-like jellyroll fold domain-containing protein [Melioribacter sp. OK-6-Me]|uniref:LamG-like jellyroll fold domain-containing protein n=1 Tax=unclassified Melioribacter TaxID=2627329 RepID=UPI003ED854CA
MMTSKILYVIPLLMLLRYNVCSQQLSIERIEEMPEMPQPYQMRNWKEVAITYDSIVYYPGNYGEHMPFLFFITNSINYPEEISFGLHSYVGTYNTESTEAINVLPSLVGAALCGIDKSNQYGYNWVKMSREYFNRNQNVYKNSPKDNTYDDWWYESMPNVFFTQLFYLFPTTENFKEQFIKIADRFLDVVKLSGGSYTPWKFPDFNQRGWDFITMKAFKQGINEPEVAGAIAYILYNAFKVTGEKKYLSGAELCLEFLDSLSENPAYEIQLPYGVITAARMNAEIGTNYNLYKMLNWCFSKTNLRNWNVLLGKWGVYDISGLIGEDSEREYAFSMNTFQQAGALLPLVKYDERFANTLGKWLLNVANASRLFYSRYLDNLHQDSEYWSEKFDLTSSIAYEALLKSESGWPFATGDAVKGGWARTNLSLYSSSSVGYLAALVDTTNIKGILKINLNKTDFFGNNDFSTYMLYNPYNENQNVEIDVQSIPVNIYEMINNKFLAFNISGSFNLEIPPRSSVVIRLIPSDANIEYEKNVMKANGVVVDYNHNYAIYNKPPRIKCLATEKEKIMVNDTIKIYCTAVDPDNEPLRYVWSANSGTINPQNNLALFVARTPGQYKIYTTVYDSHGNKEIDSITIDVVENVISEPVIESIKADCRKVNINSMTGIRCIAYSQTTTVLDYYWYSQAGKINVIEKDSIIWSAPDKEGIYNVGCTVKDEYENSVNDSIKILVRNFNDYAKGNLVVYLPFNNDASDISGNDNNGILNGASFVNDRHNNLESALYFDGIVDYVLIKNNPSLNFTNAITIAFWFKMDGYPNKEVYLVSHGSWNSRFKISIAASKLRWTIKTDKNINPIVDLDSETIIESEKLYFVVVTYDGKYVELWLNGTLDAFAEWQGNLMQSEYDFTIGQMLPDNSNYNFKGIIDDLRIYDYALLPEDIIKMYDIVTDVDLISNSFQEENLSLTVYPNPFNSETIITYNVEREEKIKIEIFNILGRRIVTLVDKYHQPGKYRAIWSGKTDNGERVTSGVYIVRISNGNIQKNLKLILLK